MNVTTHRANPSTPLAHTTLTALISDLLCEYELRHVFRNDGKSAIELVYSFPIPLDAVFVSMDATLAGETRSAQVLPARQANHNYDQAIGEGHSAVLLEQLQPGVLCVNLGNLKPGEAGEIVLRFVAALNVADAQARFSLPLVHRPRYGRSLLDEITQPRNDFAVEHPLAAEIRVRGFLAACPVLCAMPGVRFAQDSGELVLRINDAMLDRDLVLNFELGTQTRSGLRWLVDGQASLGLLSFTLPPRESSEIASRDVCLLLDCSGSMQGDAIVQSRAALAAVTEALHEHDRIQVIRFGSSTSALFRRPLHATARIKDALRDLQATVNANLGGTEMDAALREAMRALAQTDGAAERKVIILVTDGAVNAHEIQRAQAQAISQGVRIFVVAVGSSAGVDVLAPLAEATQASMERAVPAEPIDAGVMRQFRRARALPIKLRTTWSGTDATPLPCGVVYPGDAVTLIARFADQSPVTASVHVDDDAEMTFAQAELQSSAAWLAWAGQRIYQNEAAHSPEREALALHYGLITEETKAVLVKQRAEADRIEGLPVVTPVAPMAPAGLLQAACATPPSTYVARHKSASPVLAGRAAPAGAAMPSPPRGFANDDYLVDSMMWMDAAVDPAPQLEPAALLALAQALRDLALRSQQDALTIDLLLKQIPPQWHDVVREYALANGLDRFNRAEAITQLLALLDQGVELELSDEDEAQLAVLSHRN